MTNRRRGEIAAILDGRERTLCLTLGALAELEASFGADDLVALAGRFETGRMSARDLIRIIGCGLRGAGEAVSDAEVAALRLEGGAAGFARVAAELIAVTFGFADGNGAGEAGDVGNPPVAAGAALPWDELMAVGLGRLRLAPAAFWAMTPREMAAVLNGLLPSAANTLQRGALDGLMRRFPDR